MKSATTHLVYAVVGADRFLRGEALERIRSEGQEGRDAWDALGPKRYDGEEAELAEVLDEVRTTSLLGGSRLVIVDDADAFITAHRPALEHYCSAPSPTGCLVLACQSMPKTTRLHKIISTAGQVIVCEPPKGRAVISWIVARAQTPYGKRINPIAAQTLRDQLGDAPGVLDAELSKLVSYIGERAEVTRDDIFALTGDLREEKVFAVIDAIAGGDVATALHAWEQVLATDRAAPGRAIGGMAWGVRRLLEARREWENGTSIGELARKFYTDPNVLERRLTSRSARQLQRQQSDLLAADAAVKTGASTLEIAVEKFIVRHAAFAAS